MTNTPLQDRTSDESVRQFLQEIRAFPLLSPEEEAALAERCAGGDEDAVRQMVSANLRLVVSIAKEYSGRGIGLMDMIQEGCIGLLAAAKKFEPNRQARFATYASPWIRQSISRYLENHSGMIRVPAYTAEQIRKVIATQRLLHQQTGQEPTLEEIAKASGFAQEKVSRLLSLQPETCSLDAPVGEDVSVGATLEDVISLQPQEVLARQALNDTMERLLSMLSERQQQVLRLRFGMEEDGICLSREQIGARLGISKERARQIELQAMQRLKELGGDMGLEDFLE